MTTTGGKLFFTALKTLEKLEIQFVPKSLDWNRSAELGEVKVVGRSNPLYHWSGGSKDLVLELDFHSATEDRQDVLNKVSWLEALACSDGYAGGQEQVHLTYGTLFKGSDIWLVKGIKTNFSLFDPLNGMLPRQAYVSVELVLDPTSNLLQKDIKTGRL